MYLIRNYTKEAGVRELERKISTIIRKVATSIVMNDIKLKEIYITNENLKQYLGNEKYHYIYNQNMEVFPLYLIKCYHF